MNFTIGSDPEFIILDNENKPKSAIGILKNKKKSKKIGSNFYYYDNVLAECTVKPAENKLCFIKNLNESLQNLCVLVNPCKLSLVPCAQFSQNELRHPDARVHGCSPEQCAYSLETVDSKRTKELIKKTNLRSAGGHLHFGFKNKDHIYCLMAVRMLDLFVGIPSLLMDPTPSIARRKIYGMAGRYRQPSYGIEYRTIGNFWLCSPETASLIYDLCDFAFSCVETNWYKNFWQIDEERLNSDDFWNMGGDPVECHKCSAYDLDFFQNLFLLDKKNFLKQGTKIIDFCLKNLPKKISEKVLNHKINLDLYKNWKIKLY